MESLVGARYFSMMDLKSGFWQVKMSEESRQYTALEQIGRHCKRPTQSSVKC